MRKNIPLLVAIAITAFVLMVIVGVTNRLPATAAVVPTSVPAASAAVAPTSVPAVTAVVALDPATEALIRQREAQYQQALADAQAQLADANAKLASVSQKAAPAPVAAVVQAAADPVQTYAISAEQALAIALKEVPNGQASKTPELVSYQGVPSYEVLLDLGTVYIDAQTGAVQFNGAIVTPAPITADQAVQAALSYLGGGTVTDVQQTQQRGIDVYKVMFQDGTNIYVDVATGHVVYAEIHSVAQGNHEDDDHGEGEHDDDD